MGGPSFSYITFSSSFVHARILFRNLSIFYFTMGIVTKLGREKPLVIFSKTTCGICYSIKTLLTNNFGANPTVYELDEHPEGKKMERELLAMGRDPTVPTVFIGKELIGGSDEVISLSVKGELKPLLIKANAIWI